MSTTTYSLSLARSENGNWSLQPSANLTTHPVHPFPPMAFPASMTALQACDYGNALLHTARVPSPGRLDWHLYGHAAHDGSPAYRASWSVQIQSLSPKGV
jgi:hypothetical protein